MAVITEMLSLKNETVQNKYAHQRHYSELPKIIFILTLLPSLKNNDIYNIPIYNCAVQTVMQ